MRVFNTLFYVGLILLSCNTSHYLLYETCYTSENNRGEGYWLYISKDRNGKANSIGYRNNSTSIPLSKYGAEKINFSRYGLSWYITNYIENYKGNVTGKLYVLNELNYDGIYVIC